MVKMKGVGKIRYVANSPFAVLGESLSAGWIYVQSGRKAESHGIHEVSARGTVRGEKAVSVLILV